jgi:hypothetical protein
MSLKRLIYQVANSKIKEYKLNDDKYIIHNRKITGLFIQKISIF